jgi:hypothetical protein
MPGNLYGPLQLPAPASPAGATFSDPAIDTILGFLQPVINRNGNTAWQSVNGYQPTGNNLVNSVFGFDPTETEGTTFNTRDLPALFMWRSEILGAEWLAADYYVRRSTLVLLWVPPPAVQATRALWQPAVNLIASIVDGITDPDGRDPAFVVPGDTDPAAAYQGSLLWKYIPQMWEWDVKKSERTHFDVTIDGTKSRYQCVKITINFRERNVVENPDFAFKGIDLNITNSGTGTGNTGGPDDLTLSLNLALVGLSPASAPHTSGNVLVTILGVGFDGGAQVQFGTLPRQFPLALYEQADEQDGFGHIINDLTTMVVLAPVASQSGVVDVYVSNSNGDSASLPNAFTFT